MPPAAVRTIRDQIFWQYAKLIAKSSGLEGQRGFPMSRFTQLRDGKIIWSSTIREWLRKHEKPDECIYCGAKGPLTFTAVTANNPANPSLLAVLSTIRHFFDIDESQARGPSARVRLSKIAVLM
jgi:hypothetical protein